MRGVQYEAAPLAGNVALGLPHVAAHAPDDAHLAAALSKIDVCRAATVAVDDPGTLTPTGMVQFNQQPGNNQLYAVDVNANGQAIYTTQIGDLFVGQSAITATCGAPPLWSLIAVSGRWEVRLRTRP